jgi:hypothetical protein
VDSLGNTITDPSHGRSQTQSLSHDFCGELAHYSLDIKTQINAGVLLLELCACRFLEKLINETTSNPIEHNCRVEIPSGNAKRE